MICRSIVINYLKSLPFTFLIFSFLPYVGCKQSTQETSLKNDELRFAQKIKLPIQITGSFDLHHSLDDDYYSFTLPTETLFRMELSGVDGVDSQITLFGTNSPFPLITVDDGRDGQGEKIPFTQLREKDIIVRIRGNRTPSDAANSSSYRLIIRELNDPSEFEIEPNQDFQTATTIHSSRVKGFYGPQNYILNHKKETERDCFSKKFEITQPTDLIIQLSRIEKITPQLQLYSATKQLLLSHRFSEAEPLRFLFNESSLFYFCISPTQLTSIPSDYYELTLYTEPVREISEHEPNNSATTATHISTGTMKGSIQNGNEDIFELHNEQEDAAFFRIQILMNTVNPLTLNIFSGMRAYGKIYTNEKNSKEIIIGAWPVAGNEKVYLKMSTLSRVSFIYSIKTERLEFSDHWESEPNDDPASATPISPLVEKWGFISPLDDIDFFKIESADESKYIVQLTAHSHGEYTIKQIRNKKQIAQSTARALPLQIQNGDLIALSCKNACTGQYNISLQSLKER